MSSRGPEGRRSERKLAVDVRTCDVLFPLRRILSIDGSAHGQSHALPREGVCTGSGSILKMTSSNDYAQRKPTLLRASSTLSSLQCEDLAGGMEALGRSGDEIEESMASHLLSEWIVSISPDQEAMAIIEHKRLRILKLTSGGMRGVPVGKTSDAFIEDDRTFPVGLRASCWSDDSRIFLFCTTDQFDRVRLVGFDQTCSCILEPKVLPCFRLEDDGGVVGIAFQRTSNSMEPGEELVLFTKFGKFIRCGVDRSTGIPMLSEDTVQSSILALASDCRLISCVNFYSNLIFVAGLSTTTQSSEEGVESASSGILSVWNAKSNFPHIEQVAIVGVKNRRPLNSKSFPSSFFLPEDYLTTNNASDSVSSTAQKPNCCENLMGSIRKFVSRSVERVPLRFEEAKSIIYDLKIVSGSSGLNIASLNYYGIVNLWSFVDNNFIFLRYFNPSMPSTYTLTLEWWRYDLLIMASKDGHLEIKDLVNGNNVLWDSSLRLGNIPGRFIRLSNEHILAISEKAFSSEHSEFVFDEIHSVDKFSALDMLLKKEAYEKAFELVDVFEIHTDEVWKRRWENCGSGTPRDVHEIFFNVEDVKWRLQKCLNYSGENVNILHLMVSHGLQLTDDAECRAMFRHFSAKKDATGLPLGSTMSESQESITKAASSKESSSDSSVGDDNDGWSDDDDDWSIGGDEDSESEGDDSETKDDEGDLAEGALPQMPTSLSTDGHVDDSMREAIDTFQQSLLTRLQFLRYKSRAKCFLHLIRQSNENKATVMSWHDFRDCNLLGLTERLAKAGYFEPIKIIFQHCSIEVASQRLKILDGIPDSFPVQTYAFLLPRAPSQVAAVDNSCYESVFGDWCFQLDVVSELKRCKAETSEPCEELLEWASFLLSQERQYRDGSVGLFDTKSLLRWFYRRALQMEYRSGQLSNALELTIIGLDLVEASVDTDAAYERAYEELADSKCVSLCETEEVKDGEEDSALFRLNVALSCLERLVYSKGSIATTPCAGLALEAWLKLDNKQKMDLMLRGSNPTTVVRKLKDLVVPLMGYERKVNFVSKAEKVWVVVLVDYMFESARQNEEGFRICQAIMQACDLKNNPTESIIREPPEVIRAALGCIYACPSVNLVHEMNEIFNMIPLVTERHREVYPNIEDLDKDVDLLNCHLNAVEILRSYNISPLISFFREYEHARASSGNIPSSHALFVAGKEFLDQVSRKFLSEPTAVTEERLKRLIDDLKFIRTALPGIPIRFCHEMIFKHLVGSGCFEISSKLLESISSVVDDNGEPVLNEETVEAILLDVAQEYFNSASDAEDVALDHAKRTLDMCPNLNDAVMAEMHLIEAARLINELGSSLVPLQLRLMECKSNAIARVLEDNPSVYASPAHIRRLATLLKIDQTDGGNAKIQIMLVEGAIRAADFPEAARLILSLLDHMEECPKDAKLLVCKTTLSFISSERWNNPEKKEEIFQKCFATCPDDFIDDTLKALTLTSVGTNVPQNQCYTMGDLDKELEFSKKWDFDGVSSEREKAIANALDAIDSDDRFRSQLSFALSLSDVQRSPSDVQKFYLQMVNPDDTLRANEKILGLASTVFCIAATFCVEPLAKKERLNFGFFHRPYGELLEQLKKIDINSVDPHRQEQFKVCKSIATDFAGDVIRQSGSKADAIGQYMLTHDYMKDLNPQEILQFVKSLILPKEKSELKPLGVRCATADDALRLLDPKSKEHKKVQKWRCMLAAVEELEAAVALNEYPLLSERLKSHAAIFERVNGPAAIQECFVRMAATGVPPFLLTRVVLTYANKISSLTSGSKVPDKIIEFYRMGLLSNLERLNIYQQTMSNDNEDALVHDIYLLLFHLKEDPDDSVLDVVQNELMQYAGSRNTGAGSAALLLECFDAAQILEESLKPKTISIFQNHFVDLSPRSRIFIVAAVSKMLGIPETGHKLLEFHLVHETMRTEEAALEIATKYIDIYENERKLSNSFRK